MKMSVIRPTYKEEIRGRGHMPCVEREPRLFMFLVSDIAHRWR